MFLLVFFLKGAVQSVGDVDGGRLDLDRFSLGGGVRRRRVQIQELDRVGCDPDRWATADSFILSYEMGVFFDSSKSQRALGLFQLMVMPGVFFATGGR
jgi:hypothetical protein